MAVATLAEQLCETRLGEAGYCKEAPSCVVSLEDAYSVQHTTIDAAERLGGLVGWKCGPTKPDAWQKMGLSEPGRAPIFGNWCWDGPAELPPTGEGPCSPTVLEAEIGFQLDASLPPLPPGEAYSAEAVWAAVGHAVLCIEVCGSRYPPEMKRELNGFQTMADCANNLGIVLGPRISKDEIRAHAEATKGDAHAPGGALENLEIELLVDGNIVAAGRGSDGVFDMRPFNSLVWLANHLQQAKLGLRAGHVVICGAACVVREKDFGGESGAQVLARFKGLGEVAVRVAAHGPLQNDTSEAVRRSRKRPLNVAGIEAKQAEPSKKSKA